MRSLPKCAVGDAQLGARYRIGCFHWHGGASAPPSQIVIPQDQSTKAWNLREAKIEVSLRRMADFGDGFYDQYREACVQRRLA
jgi:hypothetical protein